jgi:FMN reductase (NADPH)/FMN reductase [NAD(P)H]
MARGVAEPGGRTCAEGHPMNETLALIEARTSTRKYADIPISPEEREAILHAALRAPTAGNLMLYSIIEVTDPALKQRLSQTCDDQPFIAKAPWVLVFVADYQKWIDLFEHAGVSHVEGVTHRSAPGAGDMMLACCDALIAAQNAVMAAESLGIGSCYIGDILENAEAHADLLQLPNHAFPVTMLCFGRPAVKRAQVPRCEHGMVHTNAYHRMCPDELARFSEALDRQHGTRGFPPGIENSAQDVYARKFTADFTVEMNRSVRVWIERWRMPQT